MLTTIERFWNFVDYSALSPAGCWIWCGGKLRGNYGAFHVNGATRRAHRFSYELKFGTIPKGMFVCHRCDCPLCVNPNHLFVGTPKDNMLDKVNKNRHNPSRGVKYSTNTSGYVGVVWHRRILKWAAKIGIGGKRTHLGYFDNKEDAARCYARKAFEIWGVKARVKLSSITKGG